ncbi:hypothetical protein H7J51_15180 [Mycobacterium crocinum]|uniref:Facilitated glucose transporter n=1 Tax=Mycolicibacterium crocinum TaxID=388459 RepID=A0ABY3TNM3_9MYCO|nr:hypothetical protein [Mycolicibacterium crocinum]MCV7216624.1 hypothetical protein [Mycolicibacterium crocinum]ULN40547.1 hypothetical protein MI149_23275 [Mycolicibacterium crocinum]
MGGRLVGVAARQHPDLTATKRSVEVTEDPGATDPAIRTVVLALLAVDGVISAVAGALLLPLYVGGFPLPISALISGLVNLALVWAAAYWTESPRLSALPLLTWLVTVAVLTLGGPGSDIVFGGPGVMAYSVLFFLALGATPPAIFLWRRTR